MNKEVSQYLFNQGLLLAARAAGAPDEFTAEGDPWDEAFGAVVSYLNSKEQPLLPWLSSVRRDPVFGCWHEAGGLIIQGEHDLILGLLSPSLSRAVFTVKPEQARKELEDFPHQEWFLEIGGVFADALSRQRSSVGLERSLHKG